MRKKTSLSLILIALALTVSAQNWSKREKAALADTEWTDGIIELSDGSTLVGLIKFNDRIGTLVFKNKTGDESSSYTANSVSGFEFRDNKAGKQRIFYSLVIDDPETPKKKPAFFEVLYQFKTFAVLSRKDRLEIDEKSTSPAGMSPDGSFTPGTTATFMTRDETIFFADDKGSVLPYLKITNSTDRKRPKEKLVDDELLSKYTEPYYGHLLNFVSENDLRFDRKEDLMLIFDHYKTLLEGEKD